MSTSTISLPDPHPIYKCNAHLRAEYIATLQTSGKYIGRLAELDKELEVRKIKDQAFLMNDVMAEGKKEFVELMRTCQDCRRQAILYGNYKAKNLPPLIEKEES